MGEFLTQELINEAMASLLTPDALAGKVGPSSFWSNENIAPPLAIEVTPDFSSKIKVESRWRHANPGSTWNKWENSTHIYFGTPVSSYKESKDRQMTVLSMAAALLHGETTETLVLRVTKTAILVELRVTRIAQ